jgi:hypothetical protein
MAKGKKTGGRQKGTPNKSTVKAIEDMAIMLDLNPDANPVEFLLAIMRCPDLQLLTRMKAAKDVLPYVLPSLQSIAHTGAALRSAYPRAQLRPSDADSEPIIVALLPLARWCARGLIGQRDQQHQGRRRRLT